MSRFSVFIIVAIIIVSMVMYKIEKKNETHSYTDGLEKGLMLQQAYDKTTVKEAQDNCQDFNSTSFCDENGCIKVRIACKEAYSP